MAHPQNHIYRSEHSKTKTQMHYPYRLLSTIFSLFLTIAVFVKESKAQQLPQHTSIAINPYLMNPAVAGTEDFIHLQTGYRTQWTGFEGAPETVYFAGHTTLSKQTIGSRVPALVNASRTAVGIMAVQDRTGPLKQGNFAASFAYNFALSPNNWRLSLGLNAGVQSFSYNPNGFTDNLLHQNDVVLATAIDDNFFSLAAGFWLYSNSLFFGASSFQLFHAKRNEAESLRQHAQAAAFLRHYFFMTGTKIDLSPEVQFVPSVLFKMVEGAPISYELIAKLEMRNRFWLGGNYRKEDAFAVFGGILIKDRLEVTYAYDLVLSKIRNATAGSNEIHLGYRLFYKDQVVCPSKFW